MEAATGDERRPAVDRRYGGMCSCSVNEDRRPRRPGRLDTGTSWFRYGGGQTVQHSVCHEHQFKVGPFWQSAASAVLRVRQTHGHSDEVEIPSKLRR